MKTPPALVFIESNTSGTGRLMAAKARSAGFVPVMFAEDPARYPWLDGDGIATRRVETQSLTDLQRHLDRLRSEMPVAGVFSSSEYFIGSAAFLAQCAGLPGADSSAVAKCRDKREQRRVLLEAGIPVPKFVAAQTPSQAAEAAMTIGVPVVVKPTTGTGSMGVLLCHTINEVATQADRLLARTVNERGMPIPREVLVEEFVDAPEFSVETFGAVAVGVTQKHVSPPPHFVEIGHDFPAPVARVHLEALRTTTVAALQAIGLTWGPAHTELRLTAGGPVVIEVNPRLAGGFIAELIRYAVGIDLLHQTMRAACGDGADLARSCQRYASIRFITVKETGRIAKICIQDAETSPQVAEVSLYRRIGDTVQVNNDFRDRIGHVIAVGETFDQAASSAAAALEKVSIEMSAEVVAG